jgi:hypothetical protein
LFQIIIDSKQTDKSINIKSNEIISEVKLIDVNGNVIFYSNKINATDYLLENKSQASGIYFVELKIANKIYHKKIILSN